VGWGSIIYLASIAGINPEIYEAAIVDGAGRMRRIWHVTLPGLTPVITILLIFAIGRLTLDDFDQIFNLYNPSVYSVGDVISTYTYRKGLIELQYSFSAAVGLFQNVISLALIVIVNWVTKRFNEYGIW
jgi:putative aldouronate transport system permease protein